MCLRDLFQIQYVHLQRITGPDGHWMNNATPAEVHSAIRVLTKNYCKNPSLQKELSKEHIRMFLLI